MARGTLSKQIPYLSGIELIHVGRERSRQADSPTRASTVLVDVASPQEANLIIQEGLFLGYVHRSLESVRGLKNDTVRPQPASGCGNTFRLQTSIKNG